MRPDLFRKRLVEATRLQLRTRKPAKLPEGGDLVFGYFVELSGARTYNAAGPNPISFSEIESWSRLMRWPIEPHHVALIRAIDDAWLEHAYSEHTAKASDKPRPRASQQIQAAAFDAVFGD